LVALAALLPQGVFAAFSIGRMQLPCVAVAPVMGGNVGVGLEDILYLSRGVQATKGRLVDRAVILDAINVGVLEPDEVPERLALRRQG